MKKTILVMLAAATLIGGIATAAESKVRFNVYLGTPYYDRQIEPGYIYNNDYGWYDPDYGDQYSYPRRYNSRLSCNDARLLVRQRGYRNVVKLDCNGRSYAFSATRNHRRVIINVNSRTGSLSRG